MDAPDGKAQLRLKGKVAIVTGSSQGIGRACAVAMAREGAAVVINGTNPATVKLVVDEVRAAGGQAAACACEVGSKEAANLLVDTALGEFGGLHILMNNAAISLNAPLWEMTEADFDSVVRVNQRGTFLNTQAAVARVMREQKYGKILNVTSHAALRGTARHTSYAASKMGIVGMTMVWAGELASYKINVNCIAPAARTRMLEAVPPDRRETLYRHFARTNVLQRVPEPEDCAPTAVFLASDESQYLTGQVLLLNGEPSYMM